MNLRFSEASKNARLVILRVTGVVGSEDSLKIIGRLSSIGSAPELEVLAKHVEKKKRA